MPALWICNVALRWDHYYAQKMSDSNADNSWVIDADRRMLPGHGWVGLFCAIPI